MSAYDEQRTILINLELGLRYKDFDIIDRATSRLAKAIIDAVETD